MMSRSAPPLDQSAGLLCEHRDEVAEADLTQRRVIAGGQESGRPDRAGHEALLARRLTRDLGRAAVDLLGVVLQAPLGQLQPRGLEGVGLEHVGARVEHRVVHLLDHVGTVEDERLMAAAGQAVVVLEAEVELLEGRAHAAVKDDHALADGGEIVAHRPDATSAEANLDTTVARLWGILPPTVRGSQGDWRRIPLGSSLARLGRTSARGRAPGPGGPHGDWGAGFPGSSPMRRRRVAALRRTPAPRED